MNKSAHAVYSVHRALTTCKYHDTCCIFYFIIIVDDSFLVRGHRYMFGELRQLDKDLKKQKKNNNKDQKKNGITKRFRGSSLYNMHAAYADLQRNFRKLYRFI